MMIMSISEIEKGSIYFHDEIYALSDLWYTKDYASHVFVEASGRVVLFGKLPNNKLIAERIFEEVN